MLHEPALVALESRPRPQGVLERGERADPALVLDHHAPHRAGHVQPRQPAPPPHQEPAHHHEHDEQGVGEHDEVRQHAIGHLHRSPLIQQNPPPGQPGGGCAAARATCDQPPMRCSAGWNRSSSASWRCSGSSNRCCIASSSPCDSSLPFGCRVVMPSFVPVIRANVPSGTVIVRSAVTVPGPIVIVPLRATVAPPRVTLRLIVSVAWVASVAVTVTWSATLTGGLSRAPGTSTRRSGAGGWGGGACKGALKGTGGGPPPA